MAFWKESMINRLSNLINRNRSAAKISQVLCSTVYTSCFRRYYKLCSKKVIYSIPLWNYTMFSFVCVEGEISIQQI